MHKHHVGVDKLVHALFGELAGAFECDVGQHDYESLFVAGFLGFTCAHAVVVSNRNAMLCGVDVVDNGDSMCACLPPLCVLEAVVSVAIKLITSA